MVLRIPGGKLLGNDRAVGGGPIPNGTYGFGQPIRYGFKGVPTPLGLQPYEQGTRQAAFGDAFIPIDTNAVGRTAIGIHARLPDPSGRLKGTKGCVRVHNSDLNDLADFVEENCKDESNTFIKR
jgi:lipoprotein-anchoring transpeptidase ErfK/SrfK